MDLQTALKVAVRKIFTPSLDWNTECTVEHRVDVQNQMNYYY